MKKNLLALAVLASFAGAANAASSVTLWGRVDTAYQVTSTTTTNHSTNAAGVSIAPTAAGAVSTKVNSRLKQSDKNESRIGIKVNEDLGNGLNAFIRLEGSMTSDVGSSVGFERESVIGLKGSFGSVYFGRSVAPMDKISVTEARRSGDMGAYMASATRWSNAAFHEYTNDKLGLSVWSAITTPGGQFANANATEQVRIDPVVGTHAGNSRDAAYGLAVKYAMTINPKHKFSIAAAYQAQKDRFHNQNPLFVASAATQGAVLPLSIGAAYNGHAATASVNNEWMVAANYTLSPTPATPIRFGVSYARANYNTSVVSHVAGQDQLPTSANGRKIRGLILAKITANDEVYVEYTNERNSYGDSTGAANRKLNQLISASTKTNTWGLGYTHYLSKRTSLNVDLGRQNVTYVSKVADAAGSATFNTDTASKRVTSYNVGLRHKF